MGTSFRAVDAVATVLPQSAPAPGSTLGGVGCPATSLGLLPSVACPRLDVILLSVDACSACSWLGGAASLGVQSRDRSSPLLLTVWSSHPAPFPRLPGVSTRSAAGVPFPLNSRPQLAASSIGLRCYAALFDLSIQFPRCLVWVRPPCSSSSVAALWVPSLCRISRTGNLRMTLRLRVSCSSVVSFGRRARRLCPVLAGRGLLRGVS